MKLTAEEVHLRATFQESYRCFEKPETTTFQNIQT